ncbi:hypothetical protein VNI00_012840 [Paramarasmius palmivorus]|uniref:Zn(2)-C6 fungal-type domain-containing protein n=1 Tax=Paramarasmius palmivorus TaxID=297713 RepID=A0AAW0C3Z0_9AGAR
MKRSRESSASSSSTRSAKRPKSVQACLSCRKHKTRCEVLDVTPKAIRCHRCKTLDIQCSYEDMDRNILLVNTAKAQNQTALPVNTSSKEYEFDRWALGIGPSNPAGQDSAGASTSRGRISPSSVANDGSTPPEQYTPHPSTRPGPHTIWNYISEEQFGPLDWTAPLEAMQTLIKNPHNTSPPPPLPSSAGDTLESILSPVQKTKLLQMYEVSNSPLTTLFTRCFHSFHDNYLPWLNFDLIRGEQSPLLDLVCCTIASRHADEYERSFIARRLHALTQDSTAKLIFQSRRSESLEAIQCLLILSLWAPISGVSEDRDGKVLIVSAVSMALNLRLNEAPGKVQQMRKAQEEGEQIDDQALATMLHRSRLWIAISSTEALLCIGSGREALSKWDLDCLPAVFKLPSEFPTDELGGRDVRLKIFADLYDFTGKAFSIKFASHSEQDMNSWYHETEHIRTELSRLGRLILPLGVVAETNRFYFRIMDTILKSCRLLVLYHVMVAARIYFHSNPHIQDAIYWFRAVRPHNNNVLLAWGKESLIIAEAVLVGLLELDARRLGTAPDHFFLMISFAASFLVGVKFMMYQGIGKMLPGCTDTVLSMTIAHLRRAAYSPDHAANLCANAISELVSLWEDREAVTLQKRPLPVPATHDGYAGTGPGAFRGFLDPSNAAPSPIDPVQNGSGMDWSWLNDPFWNDLPYDDDPTAVNMASAALPNVRVVVRLPENRPEMPLSDPPQIEWNQEKADILWKVIERSRSNGNAGTDWKGLAGHLEVPLPYLLYRAQARFQEDLRGLQDISVTSPSATQPPTSALEEFPLHNDQPSHLHGKSRLSGSIRLSSSSARTSTPLGIRARLNSLGHNSRSHDSPRPKKATSSSTLTLQQPSRPVNHFRPRSPASSEETDSEDEEMIKEEEAERHAEEQEALDKKLKDLHRMMTNEALGLVSSNRSKRKSVDRGRVFSPKSSFRQDALSSASASHSVSSASSPQGSIPEIPSSPMDSQPHSPVGRHMSPGKSSSPPALSPRSALGQSHRRYGHLIGRSSSEQGSVNGSETSTSFSDISDASISGSALESALLSNIRGGGSRFSVFARSKLTGGRSGIPL